ncbi:MAG: nuclear transport factor 2 family protein [Acidimicrobiales bacterium]
MNKTQRLQALYGAFADGDVSTVLGAMEPEIEWYEAEGNPYRPSGEPWIGPDEILHNLFMKLGEDWVGFTVTPRRYYESDDALVVEGRYTGVVTETGEPLDAQFCHIWTLDGDQIAKFQQYTDTAQFQALMGARETATL